MHGTGWKKLECLAEFLSADLPIASVWSLNGEDVVQSLIDGRPSPTLLSDLNQLCSGHIVIRTDVSEASENFFRPKSGCLSDPHGALKFLVDEARRFADAGLTADRILFIAHRFIRSRACAWTYATPGSAMVRVDSTWGLADGLSWLPHDTAWVNARSGATRRSVNGKTAFLDVAKNGVESYRQAPTEWIWRGSATEDQLRTMAAGAVRLCEAAQRPIVTMWFIGLLDGSLAECLPWYQAQEVPGDLGTSSSQPRKRRVRITDESDLDDFLQHLEKNANGVILELRPDAKLFRDTGFLNRVIAACQVTAASVELLGSPLAHPFYILRAAGISVICKSRFDPAPETFNKVVRDFIPAMIEAGGEEVISVTAPEISRSRLLRLKLVEEALEVLQAKTFSQTVEELADVEEVVGALRRAVGITRNAVRQSLKSKRTARGGFDSARILLSTSITPRSFSTQDVLPGLESPQSVDVRLWRVRNSAERTLINPLPALAGEPGDFEVRLSNLTVLISYTRDGIELRIKDDRSGRQPEVLFDFPETEE